MLSGEDCASPVVILFCIPDEVVGLEGVSLMSLAALLLSSSTNALSFSVGVSLVSSTVSFLSPAKNL